jgi:hypothetical protein
MDIAEECISTLDFALAELGQDVEMYRIVGTGPAATKLGLGTPIRAHVRTLNEDELTAGLTQDDHMVILSPTSFASWAPGQPQKGDKVIIEGVTCNVQVLKPFRPSGVLVRLEMKVKG